MRLFSSNIRCIHWRVHGGRVTRGNHQSLLRLIGCQRCAPVAPNVSGLLHSASAHTFISLGRWRIWCIHSLASVDGVFGAHIHQPQSMAYLVHTFISLGRWRIWRIHSLASVDNIFGTYIHQPPTGKCACLLENMVRCTDTNRRSRLPSALTLTGDRGYPVY